MEAKRAEKIKREFESECKREREREKEGGGRGNEGRYKRKSLVKCHMFDFYVSCLPNCLFICQLPVITIVIML